MLGEKIADLGLPADPMAAATTSRSRRRCCRSTASRAPTRCSARRCARPARSWASRRDFPTAFAKAQAAAGAPLPHERHGVHHRHRLRQGRRGRRRADRSTTSASGSSPRAAPREAIERMGVPVDRDQQDRRGLAARRRLDRERRRRPRHQHADGLGRAHRRLGDPPRGGRARDPVPDDAVAAALGRRARDRRARAGRGRRCSRSRSCTRRRARWGTSDPHAGAVRAPRADRGRAATSSAPTRPAPSPDPAGPRPQPGQFYMLAAAERWGGGEDERPYLPRAFSVAPRRRRRPALPARGRRAGHRPPLRAGARRRALVTGPAGQGFRAPDDGRRPLLCGGGVGIAPLAIWQDELLAAGEPAPALLGFRDGAHAPGAELLRRRARRPPTTARSATTASSPSCWPPSSTPTPHAEVYACGPPRDARGGPRAVR